MTKNENEKGLRETNLSRRVVIIPYDASPRQDFRNGERTVSKTIPVRTFIEKNVKLEKVINSPTFLHVTFFWVVKLMNV